MNFTNDELNLMCIYDTGTRTGLIEALTTMREQLEEDETELIQMTDSAIQKREWQLEQNYNEHDDIKHSVATETVLI